MSRRPGPKVCCSHPNLILAPSQHASEAGYKQPSLEQRIAATTPTGSTKTKVARKVSVEAEDSGTFPAPLILPNDDLALDPTYPPQSLRAWIREKDRNKVTPERRTVYLAAPPKYEKGVDFMRRWGRADDGVDTEEKSKAKKGTSCYDEVGVHNMSAKPTPSAEDVRGYLEVFYHGLPVKMLPKGVFCFTRKADDIKTMASPLPGRRIIGLTTKTSTGNKGIRTRPTPDGLFPAQLNLDDLLDAAIQALPEDAYALLLLVEQDLYEEEEDEFVCGRAYGGSRVAVISMARYEPLFDLYQSIDREHAWPASHCDEYVASLLGGKRKKAPKTVKAKANSRMEEMEKIVIVLDSSDDESSLPPKASPVQLALTIHNSLPDHSSLQAKYLTGLWLSRICRTAAHELGHCFGMDHCVYYACSMQGSASIVEDARQPPYLCPVDLAKLLKATGGDEKERYLRIREWCESEGRGEMGFFGSFGAWIRGRLKESDLD